MKALVVYDSFFGNTEAIARAVANAIGPATDVQTLNVREVELEYLDNIELLVIGSPTRGFRPSPDTIRFLDSLPSHSLEHKAVATFDTRIALNTIKSGFLRFLVNTGGYAAKSIANQMVKKGGQLITPPEGFLVMDREGPLKKGELERAMQWGSHLASLAEKETIGVQSA